MKRKHRQLSRGDQPKMQASSGGNVGGSQAYDAASNSPSRTSLTAFPTNSKQETRGYTRKEIVKVSRGLEASLPIYCNIKRTIGRQAVGRGIFARPATEDLEWNQEWRKKFDEWASNPGVYSVDASRDFYEDQRLVAETCFGDGGYFAALARGELGVPQIQPFDVFEVDSSYASSAEGWDDGVLLNAYGRPIKYGVRELPQTSFGISPQGEMRAVNASDIIHIMRRHRVKQTRGLPWAFSGGANGVHLMDLYALLVGEAKLHSLLTVQVNRTGRNKGKGAMGALQKADPSDREDLGGLEKVLGPGQINYVGADGEIKLLSSSRPSPDVIAFCKELKRSLASASELPLEVIEYMSDAGGAAARGVLDMAQSFFDAVQDMIIWRHSQRIYVWRTAIAMQRGEIRRCKDPMWWACAWKGPKKLTVDPGRTAQSDIKLIKNGMLTNIRYSAEQGRDADEEDDEQIAFLSRRKGKCEKAGIPIEWIQEPTPGAGGTAPTDAPVDQAAADREAQKANTEVIKGQADAYGVAVRAGAVTPSQADEDYFRKALGLPAPSSEVAKAWQKDEGTRRPITLAPPPGSEPVTGFGAQTNQDEPPVE